MKVAIIGRGFGAYAMKPSFEARGWTADLVPSRDGDAVAAACKGDYDLIAVHSPPFQHRDHVLRALEAGKHVLCDKPFGKNAAEARAMRDAAKSSGVLHFLNFEFRQSPGRRKLRDLIAAGAIGAPVHASYVNYVNFMRQRDYGWLNDASLGGGWLGALGSHIIDALRWQVGSEIADCGGITRVEIKHRSDGQGGTNECTAEDAFSIWLRLENGMTATLDAAAASSVMMGQSVTYLGSEGAVELTNDSVIKVTRHQQEPQIIDVSPPPGSTMWVAAETWIGEIEAALQTGKQIAPNFDDGVAVAEVLDAIKAKAVSV